MNAYVVGPDRTILPDLIRAFALIGIVLVNVALFAYPPETGYLAGGYRTDADRTAEFVVTAFFALKSYALFSFMFGAGLGFQMAAAERAGASFANRYRRRMIGLFVIGAAHAAFLFSGDILMIYAILGSILYAFRNAQPTRLIRVGVAVMVLQALIILAIAGLVALGETYAPEEMPDPETVSASTKQALAAFRDGGFWDASAFRSMIAVSTVMGGLLIQGFGAFAYFLFGLAAVKTGLINQPAARLWTLARRGLLVGVPLNLAGAALFMSAEVQMSSTTLLALAMITAAGPFSAFGYAGLIAKLAETPPGPVRRFIARGGSATLTAYLLQSLILSLVFSNYGLDLYAELGAAACIGVALATGAASIVATSLWRSAFQRGPMEMLLRRFTYRGDGKTAPNS
ncbi:MAG: DUF418 domain-containing protein [Pseudomonadota bacterium]